MTNLTVAQCVDLINTKENLIILDVRTLEENKYDGTIPQTKLIPLGKLIFSLDELDSFEDNPILVYCRRGSRSLQACEILEDNGFTNVYNMVGGYSKWETEGANNYLK